MNENWCQPQFHDAIFKAFKVPLEFLELQLNKLGSELGSASHPPTEPQRLRHSHSVQWGQGQVWLAVFAGALTGRMKRLAAAGGIQATCSQSLGCMVVFFMDG